MPRYKITIEYDGRGYLGWQRQPNGPSLQKAIEGAIEQFSQEKSDVYGSGRTDAGVHAFGQVAHFDITKKFDPFVVREALLNFLRPQLISILDVEIVKDDFHARFSAKKRYYLYRILNRQPPPAIENGRVWHVRAPLDITLMREGAQYLLGRHDFSTFRATSCQSKSPVKTLDHFAIETQGQEIHFHVEARSFLHHQVRNMVGTLYLVGLKKWQPIDVKTALEACDRKAGGITAAADGLYLVKVDY